jgi:excisionase family DNA binding protein
MLGTPRLYVVRQAKLGKIPAIKVGKAWRFRLSTIEVRIPDEADQRSGMMSITIPG